MTKEQKKRIEGKRCKFDIKHVEASEEVGSQFITFAKTTSLIVTPIFDGETLIGASFETKTNHPRWGERFTCGSEDLLLESLSPIEVDVELII